MISNNVNHKAREGALGQKIAMAISGGVDSSLSAHLLIEQGYDVTGVHFKLWAEDYSFAKQHQADAKKVADSLNIPFEILDLKDAHEKKVVKYFLAEYKAGRSPNPCISCNKEIKFGLFYDWAMKQGFDYVATGHYAKVEKNVYKNNSIIPNSEYLLLTPDDLKKDQTYFMHQLDEEQLKHIIFPVAHLTKDEVRAEARKKNIHVADKKNSANICFIKNKTVRDFIRENLKENPGDVTDEKGNVIGQHSGLYFYTVGQRHGFTINTKALIEKTRLVDDKHNPPPLFVIGKILEKNHLIVGIKKQVETKEFCLGNLHLIYNSKFKIIYKNSSPRETFTL